MQLHHFTFVIKYMADFGRYSLADMSWLYHTTKETNNEYHIWRCWTTAKMAKQYWRNYLWTELSSEYCDIIHKRLQNTTVSLFHA